MGNENAAEHGDFIFGLRIIGIDSNSPLKDQLNLYEDFIHQINGYKNMKSVGRQKNIFGEYQECAIVVYNIINNKRRVIRTQLLPSQNKGSIEARMGIRYKPEEFECSETKIMRVIQVEEDSPAEDAGLIPLQDFVITSINLDYYDLDHFAKLTAELAEKVNDPSIKLVVFNAIYEELRIVVLKPSLKWGDILELYRSKRKEQAPEKLDGGQERSGEPEVNPEVGQEVQEGNPATEETPAEDEAPQRVNQSARGGHLMGPIAIQAEASDEEVEDPNQQDQEGEQQQEQTTQNHQEQPGVGQEGEDIEPVRDEGAANYQEEQPTRQQEGPSQPQTQEGTAKEVNPEIQARTEQPGAATQQESGVVQEVQQPSTEQTRATGKAINPPKVKRVLDPKGGIQRTKVESYQVRGKPRFDAEETQPRRTKLPKIAYQRPTPRRNFVKQKVSEAVDLVDENLQIYHIVFDVKTANGEGQEGEEAEQKVRYTIDQSSLFFVDKHFDS